MLHRQMKLKNSPKHNLTLLQPNNVAIPKYLICCFSVYLLKDPFDFHLVTQDQIFLKSSVKKPEHNANVRKNSPNIDILFGLVSRTCSEYLTEHLYNVRDIFPNIRIMFEKLFRTRYKCLMNFSEQVQIGNTNVGGLRNLCYDGWEDKLVKLVVEISKIKLKGGWCVCGISNL